MSIMKEFANRLGKKILRDIVEEIPSTFKIKFDPIKDYFLKEETKKPDRRDLIEVTGKQYRKQVMVFKDSDKNYTQY